MSSKVLFVYYDVDSVSTDFSSLLGIEKVFAYILGEKKSIGLGQGLGSFKGIRPLLFAR